MPATTRRREGSIGGEVVQAFVPRPLLPEPALEISEGLREEMNQALLSLGRRDSISRLLPDTALFLYMYVRKEAVLSSQIEGTQSSLSDLLLFEVLSATRAKDGGEVRQPKIQGTRGPRSRAA